jgi:tetratricopeptide (TPR) repeat protein
MANAINNPGVVPPGKSNLEETPDFNPPPSLPLQIFLFCAFLITVAAYVAGQRSQSSAEQAASRARDDQSQRLAVNKNKYLIYAKLGFQAEEQKRYAAAIANFRSALLLQNTGEAHYNLANALLLQSQTNEALQEFKAALALDPKLKQPAPGGVKP